MEAPCELSVNSFLKCCGSTAFAAEMSRNLPFSSLAHAIDTSRSVWWNKVNVPGWLEAFAAHPRIGDVKAFDKPSPTKGWASGEQSAVLSSSRSEELQELAEWNRKYEAKFGHIFLICASGKSTFEILTALKTRFSNRSIDEVKVAATEQQKITELRLAKLNAWPSGDSPARVSDTPGNPVKELLQIAHSDTRSVDSMKLPPGGDAVALRPPITTHVLDVSLGSPGIGIGVLLEVCYPSTSVMDSNSFTGDGSWSTIGSSVTNSDGRAGALMDNANFVQAGRYRLTFKTGEYFMSRGDAKGKGGGSGFYPHVSLVFEVRPDQVFEHFHVPLLISPYSYTTYRGS